MPEWGSEGGNQGGEGGNQGDDVAGTVESVGSNVTEFQKGQRVACFHAIGSPHGEYAEYAITLAHLTWQLPSTTSYEEAATIPLPALTAAVLLYHVLGLPLPWSIPNKEMPLVIYGAVGAFAVKMATRSGIHPLICVAGRGLEFVEGIIDKGKGDVVLDYRKSRLVDDMKAGVPKGTKLMYALDIFSSKGSDVNICKVPSTDCGRLAMVLPPGDAIPGGINVKQGQVGTVSNANKELGLTWSRLFPLGLKEGWFSGHPHQALPGGLGGIEQGLKMLKSGKASAVKYVFCVEDTVGLEKPGNLS